MGDAVWQRGDFVDSVPICALFSAAEKGCHLVVPFWFIPLSAKRARGRWWACLLLEKCSAFFVPWALTLSEALLFVPPFWRNGRHPGGNCVLPGIHFPFFLFNRRLIYLGKQFIQLKHCMSRLSRSPHPLPRGGQGDVRCPWVGLVRRDVKATDLPGRFSSSYLEYRSDAWNTSSPPVTMGQTWVEAKGDGWQNRQMEVAMARMARWSYPNHSFLLKRGSSYLLSHLSWSPFLAREQKSFSFLLHQS